jgi:hypothetical protein
MEELLNQIPYGIEAMTLLIAIMALVSAIVPDSKLPGWMSAGINFLALNFGKAKNDPNQ